MPTANQLNTARNSLLANLQSLSATNPLAVDTAILALLSLIADNAGTGGGGGSAGTEYPEGDSTATATGTVMLFRRTDGTLKALQGDNSDRIKVVGEVTLATGSSIAVSNFPETQPISATALPLPTGAATVAKQPALGTAGTPSTDVISIQGVTGGAVVPVNQSSNTATTTAVFTGSTTSSTFTIANRLVLIVAPAITGAPTLTLQVTLNGGTTWASTSVTLVADASNAKTIEADALAKVSGAFGLSNAFRFSSTTSISSTLNLRSITQ